jgi:hypothetical protein
MLEKVLYTSVLVSDQDRRDPDDNRLQIRQGREARSSPSAVWSGAA